MTLSEVFSLRIEILPLIERYLFYICQKMLLRNSILDLQWAYTSSGESVAHPSSLVIITEIMAAVRKERIYFI